MNSSSFTRFSLTRRCRKGRREGIFLAQRPPTWLLIPNRLSWLLSLCSLVCLYAASKRGCLSALSPTGMRRGEEYLPLGGESDHRFGGERTCLVKMYAHGRPPVEQQGTGRVQRQPRQRSASHLGPRPSCMMVHFDLGCLVCVQILLIIKTTRPMEELVAHIKANHPYKEPEVCECIPIAFCLFHMGRMKFASLCPHPV